MKRIPSLCGAAMLSMVVASCGGAADNATTPANDVATVAPEPVGTTGEEQMPAQRDADPAPDALPGTASPMPLIGGIGVLLIGGGLVLRRCVNRD
jgi:hypothetical protein